MGSLSGLYRGNRVRAVTSLEVTADDIAHTVRRAGTWEGSQDARISPVLRDALECLQSAVLRIVDCSDVDYGVICVTCSKVIYDVMTSCVQVNAVRSIMEAAMGKEAAS
jgi:hypothetical protein